MRFYSQFSGGDRSCWDASDSLQTYTALVEENPSLDLTLQIGHDNSCLRKCNYLLDNTQECETFLHKRGSIAFLCESRFKVYENFFKIYLCCPKHFFLAICKKRNLAASCAMTV